MEEQKVYEVGYSEGVPQLADDSLIRIAREAEARINAVNKIKQIALMVTNARDWTDQQGQPYLQVSGSEKVAGVFNVSWRIDEPVFEEEPDGHFTYTYRGRFTIPGREIEVTGSRSSKDPFFKKYEWIDDKKVEKPISAIDKRDVKMAAMTNLLGNGITRLLGIRNLTWEDLDRYASIKKDQVGKIEYKGKTNKPPLKEPQKTDKTKKEEKKQDSKSGVFTTTVNVKEITHKDGKKKDDTPYRIFIIMDEKDVRYATFSESFTDIAATALSKKQPVKITYEVGEYGNKISNIEPTEQN